jgi:hypothetical protein
MRAVRTIAADAPTSEALNRFDFDHPASPLHHTLFEPATERESATKTLWGFSFRQSTSHQCLAGMLPMILRRFDAVTVGGRAN